MDHFRQIRQVGRPWEDIPEAYTALSYLAGVTSSIRLGALVTGITHRNPVLLGKMLATLDVLSGGRVIAGLGASWDEKEHEAYGIHFPSLSDRYDLLEDTLQLLPLLWGKGTPGFEGKTFSAAELISYPRPIQDQIPIIVGGSGELKTLRLVAEYANACNLFGDPETIRRKLEVLHRHCADVGRDPGEIMVTHLINTMAAPDSEALRERNWDAPGSQSDTGTVRQAEQRRHCGRLGQFVHGLLGCRRRPFDCDAPRRRHGRLH
jgi:alkanesulfonate monooxygenase SsuD/methylene tetrahydromethanopterin reductase-like flavin-dependent oxidoreductase (luciferase family)